MQEDNVLIKGDISQYRGKYVAIVDKRVIASDKSIEGVAKKADILRKDRDYILHFIPLNDYPMIMKNLELCLN
jgi:hypothetical protein